MLHYFGLVLSILFLAVTTYSSLGRIERQKDNLLSIDRQLVELRRSELRDHRGVRCGFGLTRHKGTDVGQFFNADVHSRARLETMRADKSRRIGAAMIRQLSFAVALVMCALASGLYAFLNRPGFKHVFGTWCSNQVQP